MSLTGERILRDVVYGKRRWEELSTEEQGLAEEAAGRLSEKRKEEVERLIAEKKPPLTRLLLALRRREELLREREMARIARERAPPEEELVCEKCGGRSFYRRDRDLACERCGWILGPVELIRKRPVYLVSPPKAPGGLCDLCGRRLSKEWSYALKIWEIGTDEVVKLPKVWVFESSGKYYLRLKLCRVCGRFSRVTIPAMVNKLDVRGIVKYEIHELLCTACPQMVTEDKYVGRCWAFTEVPPEVAVIMDKKMAEMMRVGGKLFICL